MKTAKLYMEATGMIHPSTSAEITNIKRTNYIQINETTFNHTFINQLPVEEINQLEAILSKKRDEGVNHL